MDSDAAAERDDDSSDLYPPAYLGVDGHTYHLEYIDGYGYIYRAAVAFGYANWFDAWRLFPPPAADDGGTP